MAKIENGFPGERFVVVPRPMLDVMRDDPLTGDLYLHSLGHIAHARHHRVERPAGMDTCVFLYCTWGKGVVETGGRRTVLPANHFMVLPAGIPHTYFADDDDPWTIYWIVFSGPKAGIFSVAMGKPVPAPPSIYSRIEQRTELFETMYSMLCGSPSIDNLNYANVILLHFLSAFLYIDLQREAYDTSGHASGTVNKVTHYMSENIERRLTMKELASYAGYSESYFYRTFLRDTGFAPMDYFLRMKINKASIYLIKTNLTVAQIGAKLGFGSAEYFSRAFKKIIGIPATEFRKQNFRL